MITTHWPVILGGCEKCSGALYTDEFNENVCHQCGYRKRVVVAVAKKTISHPMKRTSGGQRICGKCGVDFPATGEHFSIRKDGYLDCYCRACRSTPKKMVVVTCPECKVEREGQKRASGNYRLCRPCQYKLAHNANTSWGWSIEALAKNRERRKGIDNSIV